MAVNIVTGSMLKGLRGAGCRITTICKCKGYTLLHFLSQDFFGHAYPPRIIEIVV